MFVVVEQCAEEKTNARYIFVSRINAVENITTSKLSFICRLFNTRGRVMKNNGWKRFIRAMEFRAYVIAEREKRAMGPDYEKVLDNWKSRLLRKPENINTSIGVDMEQLKKGVL
tara:strand:+ start:207 stop:548 length:342 start_codon:yes stop_codon:yes gene_type:complete